MLLLTSIIYDIVVNQRTLIWTGTALLASNISVLRKSTHDEIFLLLTLPLFITDLMVRGVKKDFIDSLDNMYQDVVMDREPRVSALRNRPMGGQYAGHETKHQPISNQRSGPETKRRLRDEFKENRNPSGSRKRMKNRQFYVKKEWLK